MEQWKIIADFENYSVSTEGRIRRETPGGNTKPGLIKALFVNPATGYSHTKVSGSLGKRSMAIHRLVAETFIPRVEDKPEIHHINGNKQDNRVENLRWVDRKENMKEAKIAFFKRQVASVSPTGEVNHHTSIKEAAAELGIHPSGISNVLRGAVKTYKGFTFQYLPTDSSKNIL